MKKTLKKRHFANFLFLLQLTLLSSLFMACEPEVGMECAIDPAVNEAFPVKEGSNVLQQGVDYDNCSKAFCLSTNGSRPYCTKRCETNLDCEASGFICDKAVRFGSFACKDYTPELGCEQSTVPYKYCVAEDGVLDKRDGKK